MMWCKCLRLAALAAPLLTACGTMPPLWSDGEARSVEVAQLAAASDCGTAAPPAAVHVFEDAEVLQLWARERGLSRLAQAAQPERAHAVIELGRGGGYAGMAVARDARLRGNTLTMSLSRFAPAEPEEAAPAPCVLVRLPQDWRGRMTVEVEGSAGGLIARSGG